MGGPKASPGALVAEAKSMSSMDFNLKVVKKATPKASGRDMTVFFAKKATRDEASAERAATQKASAASTANLTATQSTPAPAGPAKPSKAEVKAERLKKMKIIQQEQAAQNICKVDIMHYGIIWAATLDHQAPELVRLEKATAKMKGRIPVGDQRQPAEIDGATDTKSAECQLALNMEFEEHDGTMFGTVKEVAAELGVKFRAGPPKKDDRQAEKAKNAYDDDFSKLKDCRRASIVCKNIAGIIDTIARLEAAGIDICRIKNRFDRKYNATKLSAGYRDLQLNIRIPGTGLIWELQLHLEAVEELKSKLRDTADESGRTGYVHATGLGSDHDLLASCTACCLARSAGVAIPRRLLTLWWFGPFQITSQAPALHRLSHHHGADPAQLRRSVLNRHPQQQARLRQRARREQGPAAAAGTSASSVRERGERNWGRRG